MVHTQKLQIQSLTPAKFAVKDGPFVRALDASLNSCGVEQQAYHGGSFVGNHVHECLKVGLNPTEECIEHSNNIIRMYYYTECSLTRSRSLQTQH